jgi:hypothetical protein
MDVLGFMGKTKPTIFAKGAEERQTQGLLSVIDFWNTTFGAGAFSKV